MNQLADKPQKTLKPKSAKNEWLDTIIVVVEALAIAIFLRFFLYQPFSIPTASMQQTLMIGDYFVANKFVWGYGKHSFSLGRYGNFAALDFELPIGNRILGRDPNRGDVAVFRPVPQNMEYIKRIVGMPGDRIQVKEGRLYINGTMVEREEIGKAMDTDSNFDTREVTVYRETFPEGTSHIIQEISDNQQLDNTPEYVVPANHYFMMGDNRDRSADSRVLSQVGYVPSVNLIAKAEARFFSIKDNLPPWQIWQWPANVRWDRMFQSIH
ncbi:MULTISPECIES: signal peptidase I [unclassified Devosia]|uniref:signal peptidase I n=1 Tax=unclassified Devosia TaxID=196773 RepID=UPI00145FB0E6|nr:MULTISPECIES: signal peptidase I [unclassified Devosia]MBJ6986811.1 signal peptidase I [Devosia sp. MC521]MBJ7576748.1 signal peptidase I [Devosia sp. MC532]MBK1795646.1 signal peptidase I [Devosia sp. WQ 349K1]QMW63846.1 signal peptidase I [Devosia sp. MC521]